MPDLIQYNIYCDILLFADACDSFVVEVLIVSF